MDLPLDPRGAAAQLHAAELHRQAEHARLVATARRHHPRRHPLAVAAVWAAAARLHPQRAGRVLARPTGPAVQPCC